MKTIAKYVFFWILINCNAQEDKFFDTNFGVSLEKIDSSILNKIRIIKFSNSEGVIFPAEFADSLIGSKENAFNPDSLTIISAEKELVKQYCTARKKFNDNVYLETSNRLYFNNELKELRRYEKQNR